MVSIVLPNRLVIASKYSDKFYPYLRFYGFLNNFWLYYQHWLSSIRRLEIRPDVRIVTSDNIGKVKCLVVPI